ncbi:MAG: hypothetical protein ACHQEM_08210, partial [Chitinophagales bacterium]
FSFCHPEEVRFSGYFNQQVMRTDEACLPVGRLRQSRLRRDFLRMTTMRRSYSLRPLSEILLTKTLTQIHNRKLNLDIL